MSHIFQCWCCLLHNIGLEIIQIGTHNRHTESHQSHDLCRKPHHLNVFDWSWILPPNIWLKLLNRILVHEPYEITKACYWFGNLIRWITKSHFSILVYINLIILWIIYGFDFFKSTKIQSLQLRKFVSTVNSLTVCVIDIKI